ncbi:hypothetical protein BDZ97DRAFT_54398 [Flammula alnicola]|nr:hypothetical protein BDZ97DRAFT_54398 [Flammula alnicola]
MRSDIRKSRQSQKDVPQELIDLFIDHLHDDRKALKSCGLVCKAWLPASRHHLFRSVSLAFVGNSYVGQFIPFTKLLGHSSCTFATSIQELEIYASDDDGSGQGYWMHGWLDPLLPHLPKLVSVTSLSCTEVGNHHTADSWGSMIRVHQFTDQITHLELIYPLFSSFTEHMASICAFSSLVTLSYHNDSRGDSHLEDDPTFLQPPPKSLQVLDLSNPGYSTLQLNSSQLMFRWLLRSKAVLHTLKLGQIDHITTDKFAILSLYMQFLDSSLLFLEVGFRQSEAISLFLDNVDLSSNNGVQSFDLGYSSDCFPMLPHLLSGVSGDALTDIRFDGPFIA